jgi:hypothetical protein
MKHKECNEIRQLKYKFARYMGLNSKDSARFREFSRSYFLLNVAKLSPYKRGDKVLGLLKNE